MASANTPFFSALVRRAISPLAPSIGKHQISFAGRRRAFSTPYQHSRQLHETIFRRADGEAQPPVPQASIQAESSSPISSANESPKPRKSLRPYIYAASFLLLGVAAGTFTRAIIFPPPLPLPESPEDEFLLAKIRKDLGNLPIVKSLRESREDWLEFEAYVTMSPEAVESHMTAGTLQGSRGLGVQRIFYNKHERRLIAVVFFGGALSGWPGVTHGGMVSTMLQENLERAANGPEYSQSGRDTFKLENISVNYKKPTAANSLYVVRAEVDQDGSSPVPGPGKIHVRAKMENAIDGVVCADATGICSPSDSSVLSSVKEEATSIWDSVKQTAGGLFS